jgi:hypothetical protein
MRTKAITIILIAAFLFTCIFMAGRASVDGTPSPRWSPSMPRALPDGVTKFHDASDEVTCWMTGKRLSVSSVAISCLPDRALTRGRIEGGAP